MSGQKLQLTASQLADLLNWISMAKEIWPIPPTLVTTWPMKRRAVVERWCDLQLALTKVIPMPVSENTGRGGKHSGSVPGRYPREFLPAELQRLRPFQGKYWVRWPRPWEKSA